MAVSYREGLSGEMLLQRPEWFGEKEQSVLLYVCVGGPGMGKMAAKMILSVKRPHGRNELVTFKAGQKAE